MGGGYIMPIGTGFGLLSGIAAASNTIPSVFIEPISITFDGTYLWTADFQTPLIQKIDPGLASPGVIIAIDLTSFGVTKVRNIKYDPFSGMLVACCYESRRVIIIDPTLDTVVGTATVAASEFAQAVTFDGAGIAWVSTFKTSAPVESYLYKYNINNVKAAFPSEGTQIVKFIFGNTNYVNPFRMETLHYGGGYLWAGAGTNMPVTGSTGSTATLSVAAPPTVLLTGGSGFVITQRASHVVISGAATPANNGIFPIFSVPSTSSIRFTNPSAIIGTDANSGSISWLVPDNRVGSSSVNGGNLVRIDPTSGLGILHSAGDGNHQWGAYYAFGSVWTNTNWKDFYRWDPTKFEPRDRGTPAFLTDSLAASSTFIQGDITDDGTYIWMVAGNGSNPSLIYRISTDLEIEDIVAKVSTGTTESLDGIVWDGDDLWVTSRTGANIGILRVNGQLGSEAIDYRLVNGM